MNAKSDSQKIFGISPMLLMIFAVVIVLTVMQLAGASPLLVFWYFVLLMLAVFTFVCGQSVTGQKLGALIDERNVMSLSRFQIVLWTLLVLSGYLVAALYNIFSGHAAPLKIEIQQELWWLMGISTASLVGSPLILNDKATKVADTSEKNRTFELLKQQGDGNSTLDNKGHIVVNTDIAKARWTDMFTGEEVGNAAHLDVARLQMFFFTLITALAYAVLLGNMFSGDLSHGIPSLPALDKSMVALIAISHTGYLTAKAVPHSQTGTGQPAQQAVTTSAEEHPPMG